MRQTLLALVTVAVIGVLGAPDASAGVTCKIVPQLCPPPPSDGGGGSGAVPEPGTLALLAAGAGAVGVALRRRRNKS